MTGYAPIAYFAFNRPHHATRTLTALAANRRASDTDLHIFVDGPRHESERALVDEVLEVARAATGFRSVSVEARDRNYGLFASITEGVSNLVSAAGRVIVVEDDILVSPYFLDYMNDALDRYQDDSRVGSIHAYSPPINGLPDYFFLRGADCWGWATWKDRWALFDADASSLLHALVSNRLLSSFCAAHGSQSLLYLARRVRGRNASWAILWHASLFLAGRLTLHPGASFVQNIGNDGSGVHAAASPVYHTDLLANYTGLPVLSIEESPVAAEALSTFLDAGGSGGFTSPVRVLKRVYAKLAARFPLLLP